MTSYKEIVVCFWGIGPTYSQVLKDNIEKYLNNFYDDILPFTVLTDRPSEFSYLSQRTNRCLAVLDINEERKNFTWSYEHEVIAEGQSDKEYATDFKKNLSVNKKFSYSLHRFSIPFLLKNNYTKFIILDADVSLNLKHHLVNDIQDYVDTFLVYGEKYKASNNEPKVTRTTNYVNGSSWWPKESHSDDELSNFFRLLSEKTSIVTEVPPKFFTNDGPCRFYNFESTEKLQKFFDVWNLATKLVLENYEILPASKASAITNDEWVLGTIYSLLDIEVACLSGQAMKCVHRAETRYFLPNTTDYKEADSIHEFIELNKETLVKHYKNYSIDASEDFNRMMSIYNTVP